MTDAVAAQIGLAAHVIGTDTHGSNARPHGAVIGAARAKVCRFVKKISSAECLVNHRAWEVLWARGLADHRLRLSH
jgi:hypothetical protein